MAFPIRLRIATEPDGRWRIALGDRDTRPTEAHLPSNTARAIAEEQRALLSASPMVVIRGRDAERSRAEEAAGHALGRVLSATPEIAARLAYHLGFAQGRGETAVLVIDAEELEIRSLPWELVAADPKGAPLEVAGQAIVARLAPSQIRRPAHNARKLLPLIWSPTPDDPICASRLEHTTAVLGELGLGAPLAIDPLVPPAAFDPGVSAILHIVAHGDRIGDQILLTEGSRSSGTTSHALAPWLRATELVVLDVCEAASATPAELESLAVRLVASGAPAATAPLGRAGVDAAAAFASGLYGALAHAQSLAEAVAAGRRAVRSLAIPHADSRWCNFALYVGDLETAAKGSAIEPHWLPASWPVPAEDAAALLDAAHRIAKSSGAGYVGLEHLAQAIDLVPAPAGLTSRYVHFALSSRKEAWRSLCPGLVPTMAPADFSGTPRLVRYGPRLSAGFDLETLWQRICLDEGHGLHAVEGVGSLLGAPGLMVGVETLPAVGPPPAPLRTPATALEVIWGPEDGRLLIPEPGEVIGRWTEDQKAPIAHALYEKTFLTDPFVSRAHLEWLGPGRVRLLRPAERLRSGAQRGATSTEIDVEIGDILRLSAATSLRAVHAVHGSGTERPTPIG